MKNFASLKISGKTIAAVFFSAIILWTVMLPLLSPAVVTAAGGGGTIEILDGTRARYTNSLYGIDKVIGLSGGVASGDVAVLEGPACNISISAIIALAQAGVPTNISAQPGPRVESLGGSPLVPCAKSLTDQINGKNINVTGVDKINAAPPDSPEQKRVIITVRIRAPEGSANTVEAGNSPEKDAIVISGEGLSSQKQLTVDREVVNYGTTHDVKYKADFSDIPAGDYKVCSLVAAKCEDITKQPNKVLYKTIEVDRDKYDVEVTDDDPDAVQDDCEFKDALWYKPGTWAPSALDWFGCVVIEGLEGLVNAATEGLSDLLRTNEGNANDLDDPNDTEKLKIVKEEKDNLKKVWGTFLNIANVLFIIAFLAIIISQVVGGKF